MELHLLCSSCTVQTSSAASWRADSGAHALCSCVPHARAGDVTRLDALVVAAGGSCLGAATPCRVCARRRRSALLWYDHAAPRRVCIRSRRAPVIFAAARSLRNVGRAPVSRRGVACLFASCPSRTATCLLYGPARASAQHLSAPAAFDLRAPRRPGSRSAPRADAEALALARAGGDASLPRRVALPAARRGRAGSAKAWRCCLCSR